MSFRQPKSHRDAAQPAWRAWLSRNQRALKEIGLPPSLTLTEAHWSDFLQNGSLDLHPESDDGFEFGQLSLEQMSRLLNVLEASLEYNSQPTTGWLRHRLGRAATG